MVTSLYFLKALVTVLKYLLSDVAIRGNLTEGFQKVYLMITQSRLKECLTYDSETGVFIWLERTRSHFKTDRGCKIFNSRDAGKPAGSEYTPKRRRTSYLVIRIDGIQYRAHRLAWLYVHGKWPDNSIDHIDGNGLNNRIENLRDVTSRENSMNRKTQLNNTSGVTGVRWHKGAKKFEAHIKINGKFKYLGLFTTLEAAAAARAVANEKHGYTTPEAQ